MVTKTGVPIDGEALSRDVFTEFYATYGVEI